VAALSDDEEEDAHAAPKAVWPRAPNPADETPVGVGSGLTGAGSLLARPAGGGRAVMTRALAQRRAACRA